MYSRSRLCLRKGRTHDLVKSQSPPGAPLEFLYPKWFTQASTSSALTRSDAESRRVDDLDNADHGQGLQNTQITTDEEDPVLSKHRTTDRLLTQSRRLEHWLRSAEAEARELKAAVQRRKELAQVVKMRLQNRAVRHYQLAEAECTLHHGTALRVWKPKSKDYLHLPAKKVLRRTLMKAKHERDIVWTVPARILSDAMQSPKQREVDGILLRKRTILHLTGTACENIWRTSRGGCEIHVLPTSKGSTGQREVLLHGSQAAREFAKEYLHAEDKLLHRSTGMNDEGLEEYIQWVPSNSNFDPDAQDAIRADQIQVPNEWSIKAFTEYVEGLCTLKLTRGLQRDLYPGEQTFHRNIATVLEEVFTSEEHTPYLSSHAFNLAIQFVCKHGELGSTRELLYNRAKQLGLHRQISMFNIMIEGALRRKEIGRLEELVKDMQIAGVVPDGITWSKLLIVSRTAFARRHILDFILRVYSDDLATVLTHLAERLVEWELVQVTNKPNGLQSFLQRMDSGFGPDWLTSRTLDKVLKTCADHQLWQAADEMLDLATKRNIEMVPSTVKALMYLYYQRGNLNAAIDLLQSPQVLELGYDSTCAVHWVFLMAWRQQRYNVCRVLWQYAATRGLISHQMQKRVYSSLVRNQHLAALPEHQSWEDRAGKLVIGTDLDSTNFGTQFPRLSKYFSTTKDPLQWLGQWAPNNGTRDEQMSLAYVIMHRDLTAWKVLKSLSRHDLPELLNAARRKDQAWVLEKFDKHATLAEMLANAIQVPLAVAKQHEANSHVGDLPSIRVSSDFERQVNTTPLSSWNPFHAPSLSSKMAALAPAVFSLFLGSSRMINVLIPWLQMCGRVSRLSILSLRQCLTQRIDLQPSHSEG